MLSKESFLIAIKGIQQQRTFNEEMYALLRKYDTQTNGFDCGCLILHTLMSVLIAEMDDKHDYISWWLYESTEDKTVTWTENGVERSVDLTTPEALYDYIVESHLDRERSGHT